MLTLFHIFFLLISYILIPVHIANFLHISLHSLKCWAHTLYICVCLVCLIHFLFNELMFNFSLNPIMWICFRVDNGWYVSKPAVTFWTRRTTCAYFKEWKCKRVPEIKAADGCSTDVTTYRGKWNMYLVCVEGFILQGLAAVIWGGGCQMFATQHRGVICDGRMASVWSLYGISHLYRL